MSFSFSSMSESNREWYRRALKEAMLADPIMQKALTLTKLYLGKCHTNSEAANEIIKAVVAAGLYEG